jgi:hypothetical protein
MEMRNLTQQSLQTDVGKTNRDLLPLATLQSTDKAVFHHANPVDHHEPIVLRCASRLAVAQRGSLMRLAGEHHHRCG